MKAFASNENLVLDYRASARLTPLFHQAERRREEKRETEGWVYFSPETVGRKNSLVKLSLRLSQANDVTEACNVSVFLDRERSRSWVQGVHCLNVCGGLYECCAQTVSQLINYWIRKSTTIIS